jgi:hypothetical protein
VPNSDNNISNSQKTLFFIDTTTEPLESTRNKQQQQIQFTARTRWTSPLTQGGKSS